MPTSARARRAERPEPPPAQFTTVADGVRAQVMHRQELPPHLDSSAHEGRRPCSCRPLLQQLSTVAAHTVAPRGTREACTQEEHDMRPLRHSIWEAAPPQRRLAARHGIVELLLSMCAYCGAVEVRDVSFHVPAGLRLGTMAPRRRSDVLGWYSGKRPAGRIYR